MVEGCFLLALKRERFIYDKAMDERWAKGGILGSLTWKDDSTKGAHKETKKISQRVREGCY